MSMWVESIYLCLVLSVLELSISFDNAIVNAKVLEHMDLKWRRRFMTWGILIAVVLMRLIFPIALVYATTSQSFLQVLYNAYYRPELYAASLQAGYPLISAFGGAFLAMVFFHFLLDKERAVQWIKWLESSWAIRRLSRYPFAPLLSTFVIGLVFSIAKNSWSFWIAYILGMVVYEIIHRLSVSMIHRLAALGATVKIGFVGFMYLELLDASFSFDGVIAAFAISTNIFVIMVGLGIGAFFVRYFTLLLVKYKTLVKWIYLEHGAYYAIGCLSLTMLLHNFFHVPEWLSSSIGLVWILIAFVMSYSNIRRQKVS